MPPQVGREEKELRYKISVDTADLETTFARLDQQVSAAISGMGMRPLDIFTTAERRFEIAQAISIPYAGRRLGLEERREIAEVTIPETLLQYVPGIPQIFGTEMIARQQQSVAAAGILRQTGQRVTSENIRELMQTMRRIDIDIPGIRATDVAMAASFLQAMPGAVRGLPKQEVESRIRDIVQSQEVLRETFGLTKESQIREMMVPFVQLDMADRAGAVSQLAASVSRITNRPETESLTDLFTAGGVSRAHGLPFEFGAESYFIAQAGVETSIRKFGLHGAEMQSIGGPTGAAMSLVNFQSKILKSPDIQQALAVMSERTGGKYDPELLRRLIGERVVATREVMNNFNAHRFDIYEQATQNSLPILQAFVERRIVEHDGLEGFTRAITNLTGSRNLAQGFIKEIQEPTHTIEAETRRMLEEARPKDLGIFGTVAEFAREATSIGGLKLTTQIGDAVDLAMSSARTQLGMTEAKDQGYYLALYPKAGDVTVDFGVGDSMRTAFKDMIRRHGINESEVNQYFTKDSKGGNLKIDLQGLSGHVNKFGKDDIQKKAAWSAATQRMSELAADRLAGDFKNTVDINAFRNYITREAPRKEFEALIEPEELLRQPIFKVKPDEREEIAERLSERAEMIALAFADIPFAGGEIITTPAGQRRVRVPGVALEAARTRETRAPLGRVFEKGSGEAAARKAAQALLELADALPSFS